MLSPDFIEGGAALFLGDCREVLRELPDNSVDSIVTDPPYELGFMGKKWDSSGIDYNVEMWAEVLRVAKPGAHLLAFGGTRTHHRMICAIEDAGWEIRDCLGWLYGCLSEDTELLIDGRWEHYRKAINKGRALCYIPATNEFQWQSIKDFVEYDYDDTAFRIFSDSTDQIVSRNHRCLIERGGEFVFEFAEEVAREREARVPILESLPDLLCDLPLPYEGTGSAKQVLQPCLCEAETSEKETARSTQGPNGFLSCVREAYLEDGLMVEENQESNMLSGVQRQSAREGMGTTCTQGKVGLDRREYGILPDQDDRGWESGMEGRSDLLSQARQLQTDQVYPMSCGVPTDGPQGRLCHGTSTYSCTCAREVPEAVRGGSSSESRSTRQQHEQPGTVCQQSGSQTVRGSWYTRTDLARVEPFHYRGKVWCIRVPSGAFVARRNGKVFVTGNSGFPKSLDISKALDKAAGVEREVVDTIPDRWAGKGNVFQRATQAEAEKVIITTPATDAARQWQGWGTALKPAWEPIVLARKPLIGTVAENVLRHGTGGINVDGCRVGNFTPAPHGGIMERLNAANHRQGYRPNSYQKADLTGQRPCVTLAETEGEPSWAQGKNLCDSCARLAASSAKQGTLATRGSSAGSHAEPITSGKGENARVDTGKGATGCSAGLFQEEPATGRTADSSSSTGAFGKMPTGQSLRAMKSTTSTETDSIIGLKTCTACGCSITDPGTSANMPASKNVTPNTHAVQGNAAPTGRWPSNLIHDGSDDVLEIFPESKGQLADISLKAPSPKTSNVYGPMKREGEASQDRVYRDSGGTSFAMKPGARRGDLGSAARFFYCAKASKKERGEGNTHATVKPLALMRYLCRLITPPGGLVLDPFCGSGSTGKAALAEGFMFFGVEKDRESFDISVGRIMESIKISRAA